MTNIMLIGQQGAGKDQVADILGCQRITIANPLRRLVSTLRNQGVAAAYCEASDILGENNVPSDLLYMLRFHLQVPRTTKDRAVLQGLGTYIREHNEDAWLNIAVNSVKSMSSNVVTDVRYAREFHRFKAMGFRSLYIESDDKLRIQRLKDRDGNYDEATALHKAEQEIQGLRSLCDAIVTNDSTLDALRVEVDSAIHWIQFSMTN